MVKHIAIIGGGFAGTAQLVHLVGELARQKNHDVEITIFEPGPIGPGLIYAKNLPNSLLVNHENNDVGCINVHRLDNPSRDDFLQWLQKNKDVLARHYPGMDITNPIGYVPRNLYGRYVAARYDEAKTLAASHGIGIVEKHVAVENLARGKSGKSGLIVSYKENGAIKSEAFQQVVLTTGHWFRELGKQFKQTGQAFLAYPPDSYLNHSGAPPNATIMIRGTGLSAVDTAIAALESGKYSHVTMVSRRGQLPGIRGGRQPYTLKHLTLENLARASGGPGKPFKLEAAIDLFKQEMEDAYGHPLKWDDVFEPRDMKIFLENQISSLEKDGTQQWFSVMYAMDALRSPILRGMSADDQTRFFDLYQNLFNAYRGSMPLPNAKKIKKFMDDGKLTVTGGMQWMHVGENGKFEVEVAHKPDGKPYISREKTTSLPEGIITKKIQADVMIDATGQSKNAGVSPLLAKVMQSGLAMANPNGGIMVDTQNHAVMGASGPHPDLFAIGAMRVGQYVNLPSSIGLADESRQIAKSIATSLGCARNVKMTEREHVPG